MEDNIKSQIEQKSLINDEYYYSNIFKKTEKITAAVFYILSKRQNIPLDNVVRADLERRAKDTHSVALSILNMEPEAAEYAMQTLLHGLVSLESVLELFAAMGGISRENNAVLKSEIRNVQFSMRKYLGDSFALTTQPEVPVRSRPPTVSTPRATTVARVAPTGSGQTIGRAEQILSFVRDNGGTGIKDIHSVISDCSEKTIQRELQSLIEKGLVKREGERRWSRYYIA